MEGPWREAGSQEQANENEVKARDVADFLSGEKRIIFKAGHISLLKSVCR